MSKILIMTDSASDIDRSKADEYGIRVIPFKYSFDGETYYSDGIDQTLEEFYEMEKTSPDTPKTSQPSPAEFEEMFEGAYNDGYDTVIYTSISSVASGANQSANLIARQVMDEHEGFRIEVIDSMTFTQLYGLAVLEGAKLAKEGKSADEVIERIKKIIDGAGAKFLTGDLMHLKKGGRINASTLVVANMLDIKPVLTIKDGLVVQGGKIRGSKNVYKKLIDISEEMGDFRKGSIYIIHSCRDDRKEALKEALREKYPDVEPGEILVGSTIGCHAGPDLVGIVYFDEKL